MKKYHYFSCSFYILIFVWYTLKIKNIQLWCSEFFLSLPKTIQLNFKYKTIKNKKAYNSLTTELFLRLYLYVCATLFSCPFIQLPLQMSWLWEVYKYCKICKFKKQNRTQKLCWLLFVQLFLQIITYFFSFLIFIYILLEIFQLKKTLPFSVLRFKIFVEFELTFIHLKKKNYLKKKPYLSVISEPTQVRFTVFFSN